MKKLLSICILSVLLTMMSFFTAQAQTQQSSCCFWVENMQPETFPHIANLDGTGIAQDTNGGMDLVLNNVLNRAHVGNTDVYTLHFPTGADCGNKKISIEWLVYRDGQLVNGDLSRYADLAIYTRYATLNAAGECQNIDWLGGVVENGDGICGCSIACNDQNDYYHCDNVDGHNDFPGARIADALTPPFHDMGHLAAGYTNVMYTYNFDYFYLPFLASDQSSTQIRITWKQVGNYSLVVRLRERLGGTDYTFTYDGSQNPSMYIGGHQSCCGDVLYQDSLHYLVTTAHEKSICEDDSPFMYGRGQLTADGNAEYAFYPANGTDDLYYVLFGTYECNHWKVDSIDTFQLYARINPDIVARDTNLCRDEHFTAADLLNLVTEVDLDAPGIIGHQIEWSELGENFSSDTATLTSLHNMTVTAGVYKFYVRQRNYYFDAMTGDTIGCPGEIDTVVVNVRDLYPPILNGPNDRYFCHEKLADNSPLILTAHLNDLDECSTQIRWFIWDQNGIASHNDAYFQVANDTMILNLDSLFPENQDDYVTYFLYAYNENTGTYSVGYDSVTIYIYKTPEFTAQTTQLDYVVCPGTPVTLQSRITSVEPEYNGNLPTVTYQWYKGAVRLNGQTDSNYTVNASTICGHVDTFRVVVSAVSYMGCNHDTTLVFTITAQDLLRPVIAWRNTVGTFDSLGNKTHVLSGCDSADVPAPYTLAQFATVATIKDTCSNVTEIIYTDVPQHTTCQTIVTRTYQVKDACQNLSNALVEIFTLNNDYKPVITGTMEIDPVRPLHNNCKENAPVYDTLLAYFNNNITVTYQCPETKTKKVDFYLENTNVVADGNEDIFADTNAVTIYAVVTDSCDNVSDKTPVFTIHEPAPMYIAHGAVTLDTLELCVDTNTNMHFNDNFVFNAGRPYEYQWSQISEVGQSVITPDSANLPFEDCLYCNVTVSPASQNINTSTHFVMTVTDVYGCVAADTANAIHFYMLPDVTITDDPRNAGYPHADGDTVCPNYGNFYVVANWDSNLPDSIPGYREVGFVWSGAAISLNPYTSTNLFKLACENCDTSYTPIVTVTNKKNCSATASYTIYAIDTIPPVITADTVVEMPLLPGDSCLIEIPDFVGNNLYFNPSTVSDNCFGRLDLEYTFTQNIPAGTHVAVNTPVTVTIKPLCGDPVEHVIMVKKPSNTITITGIDADPEPVCEGTPMLLTPTVINNTGAVSYLWLPDSTTGATDNVTPTFADHTYSLEVLDQATGCANSLTVTPTVFRNPIQSDFEFVVDSNTYCGDVIGDGRIALHAFDTTVSHIAGYLMDGDTYSPYRDTAYVYTDLKKGDYTFTIFTSDGCTGTFTAHVGTDTTDDFAPFVATRYRDNDRCEPLYGGSVHVVPQVEDYVYRIISDTHVTDGETQTGRADVITPLMFNFLYQDTYRVHVYTTKFCHYVTNDVVVYDVTDTPSVHTFAIDTVTDCVTPNGKIHILNTNPTYVYTINGVTQPGNNGTLHFTGLGQGRYNVHIVSAGLCTYDTTIVMPSNTPGAPEPTVTLHPDNYCYDLGANGSITISAANAVVGYEYTVNGTTIIATPGADILFDSLVPGTYHMTIIDVHHCPATYDFVIDADPINVTFAPNEVKGVNGNNCTTPNNKIQINAASGYNYVVTDLSTNTVVDPSDYEALEDGRYLVTKVHAIYGCDHDTTITVRTVKPTYNYTVAIVEDEDCSVAGTGSITVNNPNSAYTYSLIDPSDPTNPDTLRVHPFTNLNSGNYTVLAVNNTTNCEYKVNANVNLNAYRPHITAVSTPNIMCVEPKNGTIIITMDSVVPATYYVTTQHAGALFVDSNNTGAFTQLDSGLYVTFAITDLHCASNPANLRVIDSAFITPHFTITPNHSCDSTLNLPGTGCIYVDDPHDDAIHNYTYQLTLPGAWMDHDIDRPSYKWCALSDNNYNIHIIDNTTGCVFDTTVTVPFEPVKVTMTPEVTDNTVCVGTGNGSIKVTAVSDNWDSMLEFSIDGGTTWYANQTTVENLSAGSYEIIVRDIYYNCTFDTLFNKDVTVNTVKKELVIYKTVVDNTACDAALYNGSISIDSVLYAADGSAVLYDTTITGNKWTNLGAGNYTVVITDTTTGCDTTIVVPIQTINECAPIITITPSGNNKHGDYYFCYGSTDGKLTAEAQDTCGLNTDFNYEWTSVCAHASSNTATVDVYTGQTGCCWYYVQATGVQTGCSSVDSFYVCIDTLPIIHFLYNGPSITLTSGSLTPIAGSLDPNFMNPNFKNCENAAFDFGIEDPGFDSIIWANGYVDTNVAIFNVPAYSLTPNPDQPTSYCVWVMDGNGCSAGYLQGNVYTLPVPTMSLDTASCGSFNYTCQNGTVINKTFDAVNLDNNTFDVVDTFAAANGCDSIVTKHVTINAIPSISVAGTLTQYCHGDNVTLTATAQFENSYGFKLANTGVVANYNIATDVNFDVTAPVTRSMNGKYVYAYAENSCDTVYQVVGILFVDSLPVVSTISGDPHFCAGAEVTDNLSASVTAWNQTAATPRNTRWLISDNTDFTSASVATTLHGSDSGRYVTFSAENRCGTTYATPVQIHVDSVAAPELAISDATYCEGEAIAAADITITHNATAAPTATTYTLGGAPYTLGTPLTIADDGKQLVANVTYDCGTPVVSNPVSITVLDTARLELPTTPDTLCIAGGAQTYTADIKPTNVLTASSSDNNKATVSVSGANFTVTPIAVGEVTITLTSTAASCGSKTKTVTFFIGQKPVVNTPADVQVCVGQNINPSAPSITPNGAIRTQGWKLNGTVFTPSSRVMTMADSGATLTYYVENYCGETVSAAATVHVYDTAKLVVTGTLDTLCVGDDYTYTIDTNATNVISISNSSNITVDHNGANVTVTAVTTGEAELTITSTGKNDCGTKSVTRNFVVSDKRVVADIATPAAVCEGENLALTVPTTTGNANIYNQGWQVKKDGETAFADFDAADFTANALAYNNALLRYMVNTKCGESYSNEVTITVNDTAQLTAPAEATQTVCNNSAITNIVMTSNKPLVLSTELTDAGLSVSGYTISGIVSIDEDETFPYTLTGTVSTNSTDCPDYDKTETITITVNEKPADTLKLPKDTLCPGDVINPTLTIINNSTETTTNSYFAKKQSDAVFTAFDITTPVTAEMDSMLIFNAATNPCGTAYSDTLAVRVAGTVTVDITPVTFRDTCSGNPLSDFIVSGDPVVTPETHATVVDSAFWFKVVGSDYVKITLDSIMTDPTTIVYGAYTKCSANPVYSSPVALTFDSKPTFQTTPPFAVADFTICEGQTFTEPTVNVNANGSAVSKTWTINGETLDFSTLYDEDTYNGATIKLVISNECGVDSFKVNAVIYPLPVPEMLADTVVCPDAAHTFTLSVANEKTSSSYEWFGSDGASVATTATVTLPTGLVDTMMTFYVVETDEHGCKSIDALNVSHDTLHSHMITVRVTTKPTFKFMTVAGVETHDINSSLSNTTTAFKWTVDDKCYANSDEKVYVTFDIYHNGTLIPDAEISNYLTNATYSDMYGSYSWNTSQYVEYLSHTYSNLSDIAYYTSMQNHYPTGVFSETDYDITWYYLHFLTSRNVTNTFSQFIQEGDYEIHYYLHKTDGTNIEYRYRNGGTSLPIGGRSDDGSYEVLAHDVFTIHVTDGSTVAENEAPEMPIVEPIADEPTLKLYPNPTSENVNVRIEGVNGQTSIRIQTLTGKTVASRSINIANKMAVESFDVSELTPGVYVLQIVNDEAVISRKLVITK